MPLSDVFRQFMRPYLEGEPTHIAVAYSGGVDSHVLLKLMAELKEQHSSHLYQAIHINHGISANAADWQRHCERQCALLGFDMQTTRVQVENRGQGLEAEARQLRYQALSQAVPANSVILLGQHLDDQLETFLLQMKRGSGPRGLSAMPHAYEGERGIRFIRPLSEVARHELVAYAQQKQLQWIEDESNLNEQFDRNFLRHQVIPLLKQRWPDLASTVARSAALCASQQRLLDDVCRSKLQNMCNANRIRVDGLLSYNHEWQSQLVRTWLSEQGASMPSFSVLEQILVQLSAAEDATPCVSWDKWELRRFQGELYFLHKLAPLQDGELEILKTGTYSLPAQLGEVSVIGPSESGWALTVSFGGFGQTFKPAGAPHSKPLKQWFKEWKVPPWERSRVPLIHLNGTLIALVKAGELVEGEAPGISLSYSPFIKN